MEELARRVGRPARAVSELRVSDLLPPEQRQSLRVINGYHVQEAELQHYQRAIDDFLRASGVQPAASARNVPGAITSGQAAIDGPMSEQGETRGPGGALFSAR
jgi:hypothetical protein